MVKKKLLPLRCSLSTPIVPCMSSVSCFEMGSPRPVPSFSRFFFVSTWEKEPKILSMSSLRIPIPLSCTEKESRTSSSELSHFTVTRTKPCSVNFIALVTIFMMICLILFASPKSTDGSAGSTSYMSSMSFAPMRFKKIMERSDKSDAGSYLSSTISIFPDSIFEKSRISLMIESRASPEDLIFSRYSRVLGCCSSRRRMSVMPTMAFMGVRIS